MKTKVEMKIFETRRMRNNWEEYTGRFRVKVEDDSRQVIFSLPGRGGRVTKQMARRIAELFQVGETPMDISRITGCELVSSSW